MNDKLSWIRWHLLETWENYWRASNGQVANEHLEGVNKIKFTVSKMLIQAAVG